MQGTKLGKKFDPGFRKERLFTNFICRLPTLKFCILAMMDHFASLPHVTEWESKEWGTQSFTALHLLSVKYTLGSLLQDGPTARLKLSLRRSARQPHSSTLWRSAIHVMRGSAHIFIPAINAIPYKHPLNSHTQSINEGQLTFTPWRSAHKLTHSMKLTHPVAP